MSHQRPEELTDDRLGLWRTSFGEGASDAEFGTFVELVRRTGLSPEGKQIYLMKRYDAKQKRNIFSSLTGIDGYRLVADRTGKYAGNDDPVFDDEEIPRKATVTVYKLIGGIRCPFTAAARWDQYYPGDTQGFMWRRMPHLMLGKCAEALALRKAFPAELSGLYTDSEMEQAADAPATQQAPATPERPIPGRPAAQSSRPQLPRAPEPAGGTLEATKRQPAIYTREGTQEAELRAILQKRDVPPEIWPDIDRELFGKPFPALATIVPAERAKFEAHIEAQRAAAVRVAESVTVDEKEQ